MTIQEMPDWKNVILGLKTGDKVRVPDTLGWQEKYRGRVFEIKEVKYRNFPNGKKDDMPEQIIFTEDLESGEENSEGLVGMLFLELIQGGQHDFDITSA